MIIVPAQLFSTSLSFSCDKLSNIFTYGQKLGGTQSLKANKNNG